MTHPYEHEATTWVAVEIERLRNLSYGDLLALERQPAEHWHMTTADGKTLGMERQVFWDGDEQQDLRVIVDVWDSERVAGDSFIRAPNGSFVGE